MILMDLIPYDGPQFAEAMCGVLKERQAHWTGGAKKDLLVSCAIADAESKGQAAGKLIVGDEDVMICQNHRLKKAYEVGEENSGQYLKDFNALAALCSAATKGGNVVQALRTYQRLNELCALDLIMYNDTRWEGRYLCVSRAVRLQSTPVTNAEVHQLPTVVEQCLKVPDFLQHSYFERLKNYETVLKKLNDVSKFYQTQRFPVGCFVPLLNQWMGSCCKFSVSDEPGSVVAMKKAFSGAIDQYLIQPVISENNNFLKAALFHPGVAGVLKHSVKESILDAWSGLMQWYVWESIKMDASDLEPNASAFTDAAIEFYRKNCIPEQPEEEIGEELDWEELQKGTVGGMNHMEFWKSVIADADFKVSGGPVIELKWCHAALPSAAMHLSLPAGESIDEFSFSSSQRTLTKERCLNLLEAHGRHA